MSLITWTARTADSVAGHYTHPIRGLAVVLVSPWPGGVYVVTGAPYDLRVSDPMSPHYGERTWGETLEEAMDAAEAEAARRAAG